MRKTYLFAGIMLLSLTAITGCTDKQDTTMTAAPTPAPDAKPLPNMAGKKQMMGAAGGGKPVAAPPKAGMRKD